MTLNAGPAPIAVLCQNGELPAGQHPDGRLTWLICSATQGPASLLAQLAASPPEALVVHGEASFVHVALTAWIRRQRAAAGRVPVVVVSPRSRLRARLGGGKSDLARVLDYLLAAPDITRLPVRAQPCLKITASACDGALYGFRIGFGGWYEAFEALSRGDLSSAAGTVGSVVDLGRVVAQLGAGEERGPQPTAGVQVSVDRAPWAGADDGAPDAGPPHLVASALGRSWLGLPMGAPDRLHVVGHASHATLVAGVAMARLSLLSPAKARRHWSARPFEVLQMRGVQRFVVDGELYAFETPGVVQIAAGPALPVLDAPLQGRLARLGRHLGLGRHS